MSQGMHSEILLAVGVAVLGCVAFAELPAAEHEYRISLDPTLSEMRVEARFDGPVRELQAGSRRASRYLRSPRDCDNHEPLRADGRSLRLPVQGLNCLSYSVDFSQASLDERRNSRLSATNVLVSPSYWMWRPNLDEHTTIRVRFDLEDGQRVALPWQPVAGSENEFTLRASPESARAPALFGAFDYRALDLGTATLRVALPVNGTPNDPQAVLTWLEATARDVSLAYGRFPNPSPLVIVLPQSEGRSRHSNSPVPFGRVTRNGGEAVELYINPAQPLSAFLDDWTATHEFSHLMLPYLNSEARWISEGFAQYYQNVLLARSGAYDAERAWEKIRSGLERGNASQPALSPNEAASNRDRSARMKVYWAGASLALLADVQLRERSDGRESLDLALDRLQACCLPSAEVWTGSQFTAKLDELLGGEPVLSPLYAAVADTPGFPGFADTLERLGVLTDGKAAYLEDAAPQAHIRDAITRAQAISASWRRELATD